MLVNPSSLATPPPDTLAHCLTDSHTRHLRAPQRPSSLCPPNPWEHDCTQPKPGPGHLLFVLFLAWVFSSRAHPELCYVRCSPPSPQVMLPSGPFTCPHPPTMGFKVSRVQFEHTDQSFRTHLERAGSPLPQASERLSLLEKEELGPLLDFVI